MNDGIADGKDVVFIFLRYISLPNSFKINNVIVRANQHQCGKHSIVDPLGDQGVHLEMSLVKMEHQLGVPIVITKHGVSKSLRRGGKDL